MANNRVAGRASRKFTYVSFSTVLVRKMLEKTSDRQPVHLASPLKTDSGFPETTRPENRFYMEQPVYFFSSKFSNVFKGTVHLQF